jgi:hypothetical protein
MMGDDEARPYPHAGGASPRQASFDAPTVNGLGRSPCTGTIGAHTCGSSETNEDNGAITVAGSNARHVFMTAQSWNTPVQASCNRTSWSAGATRPRARRDAREAGNVGDDVLPLS